jgi:iron complex transport system substrate-binding protein
MRPFYVIISALLVFASCADRRGSPALHDALGKNISGNGSSYARGFRVYQQEAYTILQVTDPWQQSRNMIFSYVLAPARELIPDSLLTLPFIQTPVERVVTLSTTHVAMIDQLGQHQSIVGISGSEYIFSPVVQKGIETGSIRDVGYGQGLDYETIVRLDPDVLFLYGVEGNVMTILEKLTDLGIPAVFCGEYLEPHPLGKAEWIRFFSHFYGVEEQAAGFFRKIDSAYCALSDLVSDVSSKPLVLNGLPWKDTWYMAGGKSFAAKLIEDAGGDYLWNDHPSTQAVPLDLEAVYLRAANADIWINPGAANRLDDISLLDERLGELEVVKNARVFNNNARCSDGGGNDYWESGTVRPDLVLADLISVFHPDLMTDHRFVYYRKLK